MIDWYKKVIEEPVRNVVRLLRDNGFNTEDSCGHKMYVQCQYLEDGEIKRLHDLLFNNGYRDYRIEVFLEVIGGHGHSGLEIKLPKHP